MRLIDSDQLLDFIKFDEQIIAPGEHTAEDIVMMIQTAPTISAPPNDPLTLEELREMDGEPVWDPNLSEWGVVDIYGFNGEGCVRYVNNWWHPRCLMSRRFYRRKPEEGKKRWITNSRLNY